MPRHIVLFKYVSDPFIFRWDLVSCLDYQNSISAVSLSAFETEKPKALSPILHPALVLNPSRKINILPSAPSTAKNKNKPTQIPSSLSYFHPAKTPMAPVRGERVQTPVGKVARLTSSG